MTIYNFGAAHHFKHIHLIQFRVRQTAPTPFLPRNTKRATMQKKHGMAFRNLLLFWAQLLEEFKKAIVRFHPPEKIDGCRVCFVCLRLPFCGALWEDEGALSRNTNQWFIVFSRQANTERLSDVGWAAGQPHISYHDTLCCISIFDGLCVWQVAKVCHVRLLWLLYPMVA